MTQLKLIKFSDEFNFKQSVTFVFLQHFFFKHFVFLAKRRKQNLIKKYYTFFKTLKLSNYWEKKIEIEGKIFVSNKIQE